MDRFERDYLKSGQSINLSTRSDGSAPEQYLIRSVIGEGGSTVCYEAVRMRDRQSGKLKEFYPIDAAIGGRNWYYSLRRLDNGQLVPRGGTVRKFDELCKEYLGPYSLLREAMENDPYCQVLKNYIQIGEVLYGCLEKEINDTGVFAKVEKLFETGLTAGYRRTTVYIWSPGVFGQGFDQYLAEVRKAPERRSDYKLHNILKTVIALTDCIKALHTAGLLHLDIKPSNFLVPFDSDLNINASSISMYDINTLYAINSDFPKIAGTEGYRAPEVLKGKADINSDIYSIGAMLFNAIIISKDIPDGLYTDKYYEKLDQLVKHSRLIEGSQSNSDVRLMSILANILKKCLARNPKKRYRSCGELLEKLKAAELRSSQYAVSAKLIGQNKKLAIVDVNEKGINDATIVIQKLLYEHPLYEMLEDGAREINVLVAGSGTYGQKFIDLCLQAGQMKGYSLRITAISSTPKEDRESYLQFRPAIAKFVNVDGSMNANKENAYGDLNFMPLLNGVDADPEVKFSRSDMAENRELVSAIIAKAVKGGHTYNYIFIALGNDRLNAQVARVFAEVTGNWGAGTKCPVCYVSERVKRTSAKPRSFGLYPVCINEQITPETIDPRLEQMAFNTHISWNSSLNIDVSEAFDSFRKDRYAYSSSLAYALSIKYKLYSIGIRETDTLEASKLFSKQVLAGKDADTVDLEAKKKFDVLVALEHRRWVLNLITEGWAAPLDKNGKLRLDDCVVNGTVRDTVNRTHPCLVFSSESDVLNGKDYQENGHQKWDDPNIDADLDELDRMSIELHQRFKAHSEAFKKNSPLQSEEMNSVWNLISTCEENVIRAYRQFQFCLKNILNGVESYTRQYGYYEGIFKDSLNTVPTEIKYKVEDRLALIAKLFFPVVEANLYRNYKANDEILVEKIPFILSYRFQSCIAMAFEDGNDQNGRNEAAFANVAAATVLSPQKIEYLHYFHQNSSVELLTYKIVAVLNYLSKRKVHCTVGFAVACRKDISDEQRDRLQKSLERIKERSKSEDRNATLGAYEIFDCTDGNEAMETLLGHLNRLNIDLYDGSTKLFESALDNGMFVSRIVKGDMAYFEFAWKRKKFTKHYGCDYLQFIKDDSYVRINDMFSLMNAANIGSNLPEFANDYEVLWGIYTGNYLSANQYEYGIGNWNNMCMALARYENGQKPLAIIPLKAGAAKKKMVYFLPEYTFKTVKYILAKLLAYGVVDNNSTLISYTSDTCKLEITADESLKGRFDALFAQPQLLLGYYGVEVINSADYGGKSIQIRCNNTTVTNANLDPEGKNRHKFSYMILQELQSAHYISRLSRNTDDPRLVSFVYSSPRIKKLLTSAGQILEVYTYYQALKTGYFDDIVCGYEFRWDGGDVRNELDLVLTKGFRSMIVECKAVQKLEHEYYHKLHSIAEHFGIGTIKVLVGNIYRHMDKNINAVNEMQLNRGSQLNIITVFKQEEIENIGNTLVKLMETM